MTDKEIRAQLALGTITRTKIFVFGFKLVCHGRIRVVANTQEEADEIINKLKQKGDVDQVLYDYYDSMEGLGHFEFDESPKMDDDEEMSRDLTGEEMITIEKDYPDEEVYADTEWGVEDEVQT